MAYLFTFSLVGVFFITITFTSTFVPDFSTIPDNVEELAFSFLCLSSIDKQKINFIIIKHFLLINIITIMIISFFINNVTYCLDKDNGDNNDPYDKFYKITMNQQKLDRDLHQDLARRALEDRINAFTNNNQSMTPEQVNAFQQHLARVNSRVNDLHEVNTIINNVDYYTEEERNSRRSLYNNIALSIILISVGVLMYINRDSILDFFYTFTQTNLQNMGRVAINLLRSPNPLVRQIAREEFNSFFNPQQINP